MEKLRYLFIFINFVLYLVVVALWIAIPEEKTLNLSTSIFALTMTVALLWSRRERIEDYLRSGHFTKLVSSGLNAFLVFCILGLINYLLYKHPWQIDVTNLKDNSLTQQSVQVVNSFKGEPLHFKIFARRNELTPIKLFLDRYRLHGDVSIQGIDPDLNPGMAKEYGVVKSGTVVVEYQGRKKKVTRFDEESITNALIHVSREREPKIYFLTGHGELDISNEGEEGISQLATLLKDSFYHVQKLNLSQKKSVPTDADLLVILSPSHGLLQGEKKLLAEYLNSGGNLLLGLMPYFDKVGKSEVYPYWHDFLAPRGIKLHNAIIIDKASHVNGSEGTVPIIGRYNKQHVATRDFQGQTFFPLLTPLEKIEEFEKDYDLKRLALTNAFPHAWAKNNFTDISKSNWKYNPQSDLTGPFAIGISSSPLEGKGGKILALGNATFVSNIYFGQGRNFDFFLNQVAWLAEDTHLIATKRPALMEERLMMSAPQRGITIYFSVFFAPLILVGVALVIYQRKQKFA